MGAYLYFDRYYTFNAEVHCSKSSDLLRSGRLLFPKTKEKEPKKKSTKITHNSITTCCESGRWYWFFTLMIKKENAHTKRAEISFGQRLKNHKIPAQYSECHVSDRPANSINIIAALQKMKWITTLEQLLCVLGALVIGIVQCVNN